MELKRHWIGQQWFLPGVAGNDIARVSRSLFTSTVLQTEHMEDQCTEWAVGISPPHIIGRAGTNWSEESEPSLSASFAGASHTADCG